MSIIQKYLTKEIAKQFGIVLIAVICIYVIVDFFEKSDNFVKAGLPLSKTFVFFLLNIPFIISQITPVGMLLAVFIIFILEPYPVCLSCCNRHDDVLKEE